MNNKILIAYFSRAGNNYVGGEYRKFTCRQYRGRCADDRAADRRHTVQNRPGKKYSNDYTRCTEEAQNEIRTNARPELSEYLDNIDDYDTIILGFPNYWGTMPMPVCTFLDRYDFSGKMIFPLCTNEGSGMGNSENDIKKLCPSANVHKGLAVRGGSVKNAQSDIERWLKMQEI